MIFHPYHPSGHRHSMKWDRQIFTVLANEYEPVKFKISEQIDGDTIIGLRVIHENDILDFDGK